MVEKPSNENDLLKPPRLATSQPQPVTDEARSPSLSSPTRIRFAEEAKPQRTYPSPNPCLRRRRSFANTGVGAHGIEAHPRFSRPLSFEVGSPESSKVTEENQEHPKHHRLEKHLETYRGYIGRNSQFLHLTEEERRKLGGIEYDAICLLSWVVPLYFVLFQLIGVLGCGAGMQINLPDTARENGISVYFHLPLTSGGHSPSSANPCQAPIPSGQALSSLSPHSTTPAWPS